MGSPHTSSGMAWALGLFTEALTAGSASEQAEGLRTLLKLQCGDGLMHESVHVDNLQQCTRKWFEVGGWVAGGAGGGWVPCWWGMGLGHWRADCSSTALHPHLPSSIHSPSFLYCWPLSAVGQRDAGCVGGAAAGD